ncbi:hypothetical protein HYV86_03595 [Candidatus Woesearchaeota archaeon]|nr:hypothetical protein [Candidatus Woesearchaeota archaeon]
MGFNDWLKQCERVSLESVLHRNDVVLVDRSAIGNTVGIREQYEVADTDAAQKAIEQQMSLLRSPKTYAIKETIRELTVYADSIERRGSELAEQAGRYVNIPRTAEPILKAVAAYVKLHAQISQVKESLKPANFERVSMPPQIGISGIDTVEVAKRHLQYHPRKRMAIVTRDPTISSNFFTYLNEAPQVICNQTSDAIALFYVDEKDVNLTRRVHLKELYRDVERALSGLRE